MDYFGYLPHIPPDDPPPPTEVSLTAALKAAIQNKDIGKARAVFDTAFWHKIEIVPDWHQLLTAVALKDRAMIRLLALHGARWTEEETRCLKDIFSPQWTEFAATLRNAGVPINAGNPAQAPDTYANVRMRLHILDQAKASLPPEAWAQKKKETDDMLSQGVIDFLNKNQPREALKLLRLRHLAGVIEFDLEFKKLLRRKDCAHALDMLDRLRGAGRVEIKPLTLDLGIFMHYPEAVAPLYLRKLLAPSQPDRIWLILGLAAAQKYTPHGKSALDILFGFPAPPVTAAEAERFITFYPNAPKDAAAIDRVCDHLTDLDFFNAPVWTAERLRNLCAQAPDSSSLKKTFNRKLAEDRFRKMPAASLAQPENLAALAEAHRKGHYRAMSSQVSDLLRALQERYASGYVPNEVKEALRTMRESGIIFGYGYYASSYMGKKAPGMAKVLLDLDILKPDNFYISNLREKAELPAGMDNLYWQKNTSAYTEFYFQVALEQYYPNEFIPQRGKIPSYHAAFKARMFKQAPPPPQPPRRKWFW